MRNVYEERTAEQTEIQRRLLQGTAEIRSSNFGKAWRGIFSYKAAEVLAVRTNCSLRSAYDQLSGEFPVTAKSLVALNNLCV